MEGPVHQVIVKLLDGKSKTLNFPSPWIPTSSLKALIHQFTRIPTHHQLLLSNGRHLNDDASPLLIGPHPPTVHLLVRLRGGKGGFGSLLRGAATKAGQKKTNNFDACRDMSGRRLRHVNAEKRMEEWRAGAEERRMERVAEEFIKKKVKEAKKGGGGGGGKGGGDGADKYVEKYRKDSAKCMEEVEKSVRESLAGLVGAKRKGKGKAAEVNGVDSKRLKIWMGKRKLAGSDIDDTDEDDSDDEIGKENEKSVVINNGKHLGSDEEADGCSASVTGGKLDGDSSGECMLESVSDEEEEIVLNGRVELCASPKGTSDNQGDGLKESASDVYEEGIVENIYIAEGKGLSKPTSEIEEVSNLENGDISCVEVAPVSDIEAIQPDLQELNKSDSAKEDVCQTKIISTTGEGGVSAAEGSGDIDFQNVHAEPMETSTNVPHLEKPLKFDEYSSSSEMEVLGMERLKSELQARGLKCGGTLQERAARLFLLKTTPVEMLPKKLLAKK
ncbi:hypothetical protein RJ639_041613 [Escallonia herrerae]|uniref:Ubiquitin-like domain-containing protein n=1 Tax=Escallonia herrerae TaxID=1293975 RepID=A0AA89B5D5_9ASTE|nr:hypothetical protein RJ639_041613 [Escallonia herrerae]